MGGSKLADVAAIDGTTVEQKEGNHHHSSVKAALRQANKEPTIAHERLHRISGKRGDNVNHKFESLELSRNDHVSDSRLRSGHSSDLKYWLHKVDRALIALT